MTAGTFARKLMWLGSNLSQEFVYVGMRMYHKYVMNGSYSTAGKTLRQIIKQK
jgi:hypothetical protein